jgi:broad specificity phosphatase PhoE
MNTLYLVRHAENPANITKEFSHRKVDYPLTEKGVLQAQQTAAYLRDKQVDEVYSSPMKRAVQTAQAIADVKGLTVTVMEEFREVDAGVLEDMPPTDENWRTYMGVVRDWFEGRPESAFPGGENYFDVERRARKAIEEILGDKNGKGIVIVGHGGIFTVTVTSLCRGSDLSIMRDSPYQNCAVTEVAARYNGSGVEATLTNWNYCDHLSGEAADLVPAVPDSLAGANEAQNVKRKRNA